MKWLERLRPRRRSLEADVGEEVSYHFDRLEAEGRALGLDPEQAGRAARARFGDPALVRARTRDVAAVALLETLQRELRYAWRSLIRDPLTTVTVIVCLALGVGLTASLYGALDALVFHDVTGRRPEDLVRFQPIPYPIWREVRDSGVFESLAAGAQCAGPVRWREGNEQRAVVANCLSANFWEAVGAAPARGRLWTDAEAELGLNPHVVVLSHRFWRRLGGTDDILGQALVLNGLPYTVLGVLPPTYKAIQGYGISPDLYVPFNFSLHPRALERDAPPRDRVQPVGRLKAGWDLERTEDALASSLRAWREEASFTRPRLTPVAGVSKYSAEGFDRMLLTLSAVVSGVGVLFFAIACANAASMMLARASRQAERYRLFRALGATSSQVARQQLVESFLLGALGTIAGITLCWAASRWSAFLTMPVQDVMISIAFVPNASTVVIGASVGVLSALAAGILPALQARRTSLDAMNARVIPAEPRIRRRLLAAQVCASAVLLFITHLAWQNTRLVTDRSPGFTVADIAWMDVTFDRRLPSAELQAQRRKIVQRLQAHASVAQVSWAWYLPFQVAYPEPRVQSSFDGRSFEAQAIEQGVGPGYFDAMRIRVLDGREFAEQDLSRRDTGRPLVVINETLARTLYPDRSAVGETIWRIVPAATPVPMTILGVVAETAFRVPGEAAPAMIHGLAPQTSSLIVRTVGNAATTIPVLSRVIDGAVPGAAAGGFPFSERVARAAFPARAMTLVFGAFGVSGLLMTIIALVGLVSYNVARQRREIGIRLALGSSPAGVVSHMVGHYVRVVTVGAALGCAFGVVLGARFSHLIAVGLSPVDPTGIALTIAGLLLVAALIVAVMVRRATRSSPSCILARE